MDASTDFSEPIASLLQELSAVQADLLKLLARKRELVAARDSVALNQLHGEEERLISRMRACCQQRQRLLSDADEQGLPAKSLGAIAESLPGESRNRLRSELRDAQRQSRLLQHQSLANWVLVQRSLLHLSQMMEIIATGGRMRPTYGREPAGHVGGALVDHAV